MKTTKKEFKETKEKLYLTLPEKLKEVKVTKEELETYKDKYADMLEKYGFDEVLERVNILGKLNLIQHEINIHKNLDEAIDFLTFVEKKLGG